MVSSTSFATPAKPWGRDQLLVYRDKLDDALKMRGQNPRIGNHSDELPDTHRLYYVGSHVMIVYRTLGRMISIVRILHQRMSLARHV